MVRTDKLSILLFSLLLCISWTGQLRASENEIKLIIDVSGSMKKTDPDNLRRPAVNLLMNLLPEDASSGVWLFGDKVEPLVPFSVATSRFKQNAIAQSQKIHSKGLLTDIGAALEQALLTPMSDFGKSSSENAKIYGGKAILLSDGMVDLGPDETKNLAERVRIEHRLIPQLKAAGIEVHTVALSENADKEVLEKIALGTGGLFEVARSPEDLTKIFLRLFDDAVIQDRLPLAKGRFLVDSSVEEFTLLSFHAEDATPIQVRAPDDQFYLYEQHPESVSWYQDAGYDLVTIKNPMEGEWRLFADEDPQNRVTVLSDLKLHVTNLDNMIHEASFPSLDVRFYQEDTVIEDESFLALMDVQLIVLTPAGKRIARSLSSFEQGTYTSDLGVFAEPGRYRITVNVDGQTFQREVVQEVEYGSPAKVAYNSETSVLLVRPIAVGMIGEQLRMIARLEDANNKKRLVPLLHNGEIWQAILTEIEPGDYKVTVHVKGNARSGQPLDFDLQPIELNVREPVVENSLDNQEESSWTLNDYLIAAAVVLGNILVAGTVFWLWRRKPASETDEIADLIASVPMDDDAEASSEVEEAQNQDQKQTEEELQHKDQPKQRDEKAQQDDTSLNAADDEPEMSSEDASSKSLGTATAGAEDTTPNPSASNLEGESADDGDVEEQRQESRDETEQPDELSAEEPLTIEASDDESQDQLDVGNMADDSPQESQEPERAPLEVGMSDIVDAWSNSDADALDDEEEPAISQVDADETVEPEQDDDDDEANKASSG